MEEGSVIDGVRLTCSNHSWGRMIVKGTRDLPPGSKSKEQSKEHQCDRQNVPNAERQTLIRRIAGNVPSDAPETIFCERLLGHCQLDGKKNAIS